MAPIDVGGCAPRRRAARRRAVSLAGALGLASLVILGAIAPALAAAREVVLTGYDQLALPGEQVTARFKVERPGVGIVRPDVRGVEVEVFLYDAAAEGWTALGRARSAADGYADLRLTAPAEPGDHWLSARAIGADRSAWQMAYLGVRPRGARVIVTDIDQTIYAGSLVQLFAGAPAGARPLRGAVDGLSDLAVDATVVYLTARDDALRARTLAWLEHWGFPQGAVYLSDGIELGQDPTRYKAAVVAGLAARFDVAIAFGDKPTDLAAYRRSGVPTVMFERTSERDGGPLAEAAGVYRDWEALRAAVRGGRHADLFAWARRFRE